MSVLINISIFIKHIRIVGLQTSNINSNAGTSLSIQQMINGSISIGISIRRSINTYIYIYIIRIYVY